MNTIRRIKRVAQGRIQAFLSTMGDPEIVFPQFIGELEEQLRVSIESEAKAKSAMRSAERALAQGTSSLESLLNGSKAALRNYDEAMASETRAVQVGV